MVQPNPAMGENHVAPRQSASLIRQQAPKFEVPAAFPNSEIKTVKLEDYKGKFVILLFYPMDFTFVCPTELLAFSDNLAKFRDIQCEVLGVSCDSEYAHLAWMNMPRKAGGLGPDFRLPLLADRAHFLSKEYGCLLDKEGFPLRALYIIGPEGNVRASMITDTAVGRSVDEAFRLVQAFQFSDKHGEVCPVNFKPEERKNPLYGDPVKAKAYFSAVN